MKPREREQNGGLDERLQVYTQEQDRICQQKREGWAQIVWGEMRGDVASFSSLVFSSPILSHVYPLPLFSFLCVVCLSVCMVPS